MLSGGGIMIKKCFYCKHYTAESLESDYAFINTIILNCGRCVHRAHRVDDSFSCEKFEINILIWLKEELIGNGRS